MADVDFSNPKSVIIAAASHELGLTGWFIEPGAFGDLTVWRPDPDFPSRSFPVITEGEAGPHLWPIFTTLIPTKGT